MKRSLILIPAFLSIAQFSKAQTEKGSQTLGISTSFNYYNQSAVGADPYNNNSLSSQSNKYTLFSIGPTYSYFIANNLDLGTTLNYSINNYYSGPSYDAYKQDNKNYGGTVFLRKYVLYKNKIGFRAGPYLGYSTGEQKYIYTGENSIDNTYSTLKTYGGGANLDLVYYPEKHLGIAVSIANVNYEHTKTDSGPRGFANTDQVNFDFINSNLGLSFLYVFGGK